MASQSRHSARWGAALSAGALATIFAASLVAGPSGCFINSTGLGTGGAAGTGGSGGITSSSTTTTSSGGGSVSSSSSVSSTSGGVCMAAEDCGTDTPCKTWACNAGMCAAKLTVTGGACSGQTGVCDPNGACVACFVEGTTSFGCLAGEHCFAGKCVSCTNSALDGDETDLDCGGATCKPCPDGLTCKVDTDCANTDCDTTKVPSTCVSCMDGKPNGAETDLDCGGGKCPKCAIGKNCMASADCLSMDCTGGKCGTCNDNIKNNGETDVDCGGNCQKCGDSQTCNTNADCTHDACAAGVCCNVACGGSCSTCKAPGSVGTCAFTPSGVDGAPSCGGGKICDGVGACQMLMGAKAVGQTCATNAECFNNNCAAGYCKLKNGEPCTWYMECSSGLCSAGMCKACANTPECGTNSACSNGVCSLPPGALCGTNNADCFENVCQLGFCTTYQPVGGACIAEGDCQGHLCKTGVCATCTVTDCSMCNGGKCKAPTGAACTSSTQCNSNSCVGTLFKQCQ